MKNKAMLLEVRMVVPLGEEGMVGKGHRIASGMLVLFSSGCELHGCAQFVKIHHAVCDWCIILYLYYFLIKSF